MDAKVRAEKIFDKYNRIQEIHEGSEHVSKLSAKLSAIECAEEVYDYLSNINADSNHINFWLDVMNELNGMEF